MSLVPLYGFLQGDTIGLLILAKQNDSISMVIEKLVVSAAVRTRRHAHYRLFFNGRVLAPELSVKEAGLTALDQIEVQGHD